MALPPTIAGLGSTADKLRVDPGFDPLAARIGPEEYFVLSRIDGATSTRDVVLMTGLATDRAIEILQRLRELGAVLTPGEVARPRPAARTPTAPPRSAGPSRPPPVVAPASAGPLDPLPDPSPDELAALAEVSDLGDGERRAILAAARLVGRTDPWALLGVERGASPRDVKRSFFARSKAFHPDRFYGRQLGSFRLRLEVIFGAMTRAHDELAAGRSGAGGPSQAAAQSASTGTQSPADYAEEIFARACATEVGGQPAEAMQLFAAAIRVNPQVRYLRRAASCALVAEQPRTAEEYAKKAAGHDPSDMSIQRLLARAYRAQGRADLAEEVLVMALAMPIESDILQAEIRKDLAELRSA
ncbi:MAG: hypothetical protein KBG28_29705 [Kofleriaceae bacterium]|jgi:hypothetical protein|nr:hypothetical protein [Kofleriaceae bacterium]MBP6836144.1 hypothetical protein [Kofleriaceae bacterium]MBP9208181.1 hypothetical protein [Kofleriaceae bacterium]